MAQNEFQFSEGGSGRSTPGRRDGGSKAEQGGKSKSTGSGEKAKRKLLAQVFSVTQVTRMIKNVLNEYLPAKIVVEGEVSNCKLHPSGHLYLTLKDENAQVAAVMWRTAAGKLKFKPTDGMAVVATGRVDVYEPQGKYQFYLDKLEPAGVGALELAFRELAAKLREEGLFAEEHKKPVPAFPGTIAMVTSSSGAAIEDMVNTLNRRYPVARKLLYPVAVQGEGAAEDIAGAIKDLNRRREKLGGIDVMIVGRGGGSLEDLWAFNEEAVARAIFASAIPVISGVGHEIDTTIADMVADRRAATPTAAAELAAPVLSDVLEGLGQMRQRLWLGVRRRMEGAGNGLAAMSGRSVFVRPLDLVRVKQQQVDERQVSLAGGLGERLRRAGRQLEAASAILRRIEPRAHLARARGEVGQKGDLLRAKVREYVQGQRHRLDNLRVQLTAANPLRTVRHQRELTGQLASRLESLNPRAVLGRGYSISRDKATGRVITASEPPAVGDVMLTELGQETMVESEVTGKMTNDEARMTNQ